VGNHAFDRVCCIVKAESVGECMQIGQLSAGRILPLRLLRYGKQDRAQLLGHGSLLGLVVDAVARPAENCNGLCIEIVLVMSQTLSAGAVVIPVRVVV